MENLQFYYRIVEEAIAKLGMDPTAVRSKKEGQWALKKGSARVWLDLWHIEKEKRAYFQVIGHIMQVPNSNTDKLFQELLTINHQLYGSAFTIHNNNVWIKVIREVDSLQVNEAHAMIQRVGTYSDHYDDILKRKYPDIDVGGFRAPEDIVPV